MHVSGRGEHSRCQTLAYRWHCGGEWRELGFCSWPRRSSKDGTKSFCIICDQSTQLPSLLGRWSSVALSPSVDIVVVAVVCCCCYETHYTHILLNSVTDKIKETLASFCMDGINCSAECILLSPPPPRFFFFLNKYCPRSVTGLSYLRSTHFRPSSVVQEAVCEEVRWGGWKEGSSDENNLVPWVAISKGATKWRLIVTTQIDKAFPLQTVPSARVKSLLPLGKNSTVACVLSGTKFSRPISLCLIFFSPNVLEAGPCRPRSRDKPVSSFNALCHQPGLVCAYTYVCTYKTFTN